MTTDSTRQFGEPGAAQQRFLSLFLRSEREGYCYERVGIETLAERSGRSARATYKMLQRIQHTLRQCVESQARPEVA